MERRARDMYIPLKFYRGKSIYSCMLSFYLGLSLLPEDIHDFITNKEMEQCENFKGHRLSEFLVGRYISKKSFINLVGSKNICIIKGVFGQPVLISTDTSPNKYDISISHKNEIVGSILFPSTHPVGIDIEISLSKYRYTHFRLLTKLEKVMTKGNVHSTTTIYSAKEALSKALRTGLSAPLLIYEVDRLKKFKNFHIGYFKNFTQYKFISYRSRSLIITIVMPRKSRLKVSSILPYEIDTL